MNDALLEQGKMRRKHILNFLEKYIGQNGYSPSIREIGIAVGLSSTTTVKQHLDTLNAQGEIMWNPSIPRTIRIVNKD